MRRFVPVAVTVLAVAATLIAGPADAHQPGMRRVEAALRATVRAGVPGVLARVDEPGRHWTRTAGVADVDTRRPVSVHSRFRIASLTKSFVAVLVLQLVAEHRLALDRPVGDWLPHILPDAESVTVRQLLDHTSGLADYMAAPGFQDPRRYAQRHHTPEQLIRAGVTLGPVAEPGARFSYANTNYIVLGLLVERVTGQDLGTQLRDRILGPLGLDHTSLPVDDHTLPDPHATGYVALDPAHPDMLTAMTELDPSFEWAAFGMVSDGRDVNRFYQALFGGRLVPPAMLNQMRTGHPTGQAPVFPQYGLGLESVGLTCGQMWGATGQTVGYQTLSFTDPTGTRTITVSLDVERTSPDDPDTGQLILAAVNVVNEYLCGTAYQLPTG
jgi:D-alanyl-D-alanine carboxypeptidase